MENLQAPKNQNIIVKDGGNQYKMLPLRGLVVYPGQTLHIDIAREKTVEAINKALVGGEDVFLATQKYSSNANPSPKDIYRVGTLATITHAVRASSEQMRIQVLGLRRMEIASYVQVNPHFVVNLNEYKYHDSDPIMLEAIKRNIITELQKYKVNENKNSELIKLLNENEHEKFLYVMSQLIYRADAQKQNLLQIKSLYGQLEDVFIQLQREAEIIAAEKRIAAAVRVSIDKNQREFYLREQLKAIKNELGEGEDDAEQFRNQIKKKKLPKAVEEKALKEILRMEKMTATSPEATVIRSYIEWLLDLPWTEMGEDSFDLTMARKILDEDHYGLEKVKERIIEFLAVHKLNKDKQKHKAPILCFVGPPGVGKTSIVYSIARAANKKMVTMSLGGVRDEAEIRGHRRTYIGSMPGRIISAMKSAEVLNPVFLLDEVDKMSSDFRGDPQSALLEVLDPNQNFCFKDHYIELPYDLSHVMFLMTANTIETISPPLLDRMEIIELSGYTYEEKLQIAKKYLVGKQLEQNGLSVGDVTFTDEAIFKIIYSYTRESGVRNLEREIGAVARKLAVALSEKGDKKTKRIKVTEADIVKYLGSEKFLQDEKIAEDTVGLATGLAWTSVGGATLNIEVALIKNGKGEMTLTGSLGEVMKESCQTALSVIKSRAEKYGIDPEAFNTYSIHIHFPEGATPKDGPSAGITVATALMSAFSGKKVKSNVAMTGEITLRGRVLAIGGLKEKSLAALRVGVKTIIIPSENRKDIKDIPDEVKDNVKIVFAEQIENVFDTALV